MSWALSQKVVTDASARHVLLCLANYADAKGAGAFPAVATLVEDTGLSERTVRYKLDSLVEAGILVPGNSALVAVHINRHDKRPACYDIVMTTSERGATAAPRAERGANDDATGCNQQQSGVQMTTARGATVAPNPSLNRQGTVEEKSAPAARTPAIARPEGVTEQTWADWVQLRKSKRAPITETVLAGAVTEAAKAGWTLEAFLAEWCTRGSQGLKAEWIKPQERGQGGQQARGQGRYAGAAAAIFDDEPQTRTQTPTGDVIDVEAR